MKKLIYLRARARPRVTEYSIPSLQRVLSDAGVSCIGNEPLQAVTIAGTVLSRLAAVRQFAELPKYAFFVPLMGPTERRFWPVSYLFEMIPYCYDTWPATYRRWEAIFKRNKIRLAFFSARQSAQFFAKHIPDMEAIWLPEATDPAGYVSAKPLAHRRIDVLELGRQYAVFHKRIQMPLQQAGAVHLFERTPGAVIFPSREAFLDGISDAKISVCFPSSITHPERSGDVETLTHRYLESIASKCVVLGRCPRELEDLFGYNPVVEVDLDNPACQIADILANIMTYRESVERNYQRLLEVGTWKMRVDALLTMLAERGYSIWSSGARRGR